MFMGPLQAVKPWSTTGVEGVFRFLDHAAALQTADADPESFRTRPCFLPALPLAASVLGPLTDAFSPLMAALWMAALCAFAITSRREEDAGLPETISIGRAVLLASATFLATFGPCWFLRGFHSDAIGAVLVSVGLLAVLSPPFTGRAALAGLALGASLAFHFTMALYAIPAILHFILAEKRTRPLLLFFAGALPGLALVAFELNVTGNPYFSGTGLAGLLRATRQAPAIRAVVRMATAMATLAVVFLVVSRIPAVRRAFLGRRISRIAAAVLAVASLAAVILPFAAKRLGLPEVAKALASVHPALLLFWDGLLLAAIHPLFLRADRDRVERVTLFAVLLTGLFGLHLKGVEVPVGIWTYRRLFPCVALLLPLCIHGALRGWGRHRFAPCAAVLCLVPMALAPNLWFGISDAGSDRLAAPVREHLAKANLALYDYRGRTAAFAGGTALPVFGLPRRGTQQHWDRCARDILARSSASNILLITSYEPCTMEEGVALQPLFTSTGTVSRIHAKRLLPCAFEQHAIHDMILRAISLRDNAVAQRKTFDGGPFGIRGPWKSANRGGCWSAPGCAIVGPVPQPGKPVVVRLELGWFDSDGSHPTSQVRLVPPAGSGSPAQTFEVSAPRETRTAVFEAPVDAPVDAPPTGLWSVEGSAVFHSAELAPLVE